MLCFGAVLCLSKCNYSNVCCPVFVPLSFAFVFCVRDFLHCKLNVCVCVCVGAAWWADGLEKATESLILSDGFMRLHLLNPTTISASAKNLHSRQDYSHRLHLIFPTLPPHQTAKCVRMCLISPSRSGFFFFFLASDIIHWHVKRED